MEPVQQLPKGKKTLPAWLLEAVFILLSVALAFGVDEFRENRANKTLADRVLKGLAAEFEHNLAQVEPFLAMHQRWANALAQAEKSSDAPTGMGVYIAVRPPMPAGSQAEFPTQVHRGAWDAAVSTGALRLIDYELVAVLSEVYEVQEFYGQSIMRLVGAVTAAPAFDPAARGLAIRQITTDMQSVVFAEAMLLERYRKHLPTIRAAAAR